jgi:hypothetical protein
MANDAGINTEEVRKPSTTLPTPRRSALPGRVSSTTAASGSRRVVARDRRGEPGRVPGADRRAAGRPRDRSARNEPVSPEDWDAHLAARIFVRNRNLLADVALKVARALKGDYDPDVAEAWLSKNAEVAAASINASTRGSLELIDDKQSVFDALLTAGAARYARSMVTTVANFGAHDAAEKVGGDRTKTWSGGTTRHASMNGQTVRLSENFSNGMAWPGDPAGGAAEVANCGCSVTFN